MNNGGSSTWLIKLEAKKTMKRTRNESNTRFASTLNCDVEVQTGTLIDDEESSLVDF